MQRKANEEDSGAANSTETNWEFDAYRSPFDATERVLLYLHG